VAIRTTALSRPRSRRTWLAERELIREMLGYLRTGVKRPQPV